MALVELPFPEIHYGERDEYGHYKNSEIAWKWIEDGRCISLIEMLTNVRLCIGPGERILGYDDGYCYPKHLVQLALVALAAWDGTGDPLDGWVKNIRYSRRRPDGTPESEYVEP